MRKSDRLALTLAIILTVAASPTRGEDAPPPLSEDILERGTFVVALANQNGLVIVADSRRSSRAPFPCNGVSGLYCDDSQKVFQAGERSGMAIAGFANGRVAGTPLDSHMAAYLRGKFPRPGNLGFGEKLVEWLGGDVMPYLLTPLSVLHGNEPLDFIFIVGEQWGGLPPRLIKVTLNPQPIQTAPTGTVLLNYVPRAYEQRCPHFCFTTAGIDREGLALLDGRLHVADAVLRKYQRLSPERRKALSVARMTRIARAVLKEVKRRYPPFVGGDDQVIALPMNGPLAVRLPNAVTAAQGTPLLPSIMLIVERDFSPAYPNGQSYKRLNVPLHIDEPRWGLERTIPQVFIGNLFRDVTVELDGNVFAANTFERVVFRSHGGATYFSAINRLRECSIVSDQLPFTPPDTLRRCSVSKFDGREMPHRIGLPARTSVVGKGVAVMPDGSVRIEAKEGESSYSTVPVR